MNHHLIPFTCRLTCDWMIIIPASSYQCSIYRMLAFVDQQSWMNNLQLRAHTVDNTLFQKKIFPPVASELASGTLIQPDNLLFVYIFSMQALPCAMLLCFHIHGKKLWIYFVFGICSQAKTEQIIYCCNSLPWWYLWIFQMWGLVWRLLGVFLCGLKNCFKWSLKMCLCGLHYT